MNEIINIKVIQKTIGNEKKRFVNARELHKWLKSKRQFADWIKDRIEKYDFIESIDYFAVHKIVKGAKKRADGLLIDEKTGQIMPKDYILTIDMAKEIAMLENNEIGKKVRKYFIRTEESFKKVMRVALENPKFINQLAKDFQETRTETKEYRKLLNLAKKDLTRNTMYEEILFVIGSFETGLSGELEKEHGNKGELLNKQEFINVFTQFASTKNWDAYKKRVRKIMATYDQELRNIKHPKLIDYKKEFTNEDIKSLLGHKVN